MATQDPASDLGSTTWEVVVSRRVRVVTALREEAIRQAKAVFVDPDDEGVNVVDAYIVDRTPAVDSVPGPEEVYEGPPPGTENS